MSEIFPLNKENIDILFDDMFNNIWASTSMSDNSQKNEYRMDALAAINSINLKLLTT